MEERSQSNLTFLSVNERRKLKMDRRSVAIGVTVIAFFNISLYIIVRLFLNKNVDNNCLLLDEVPSPSVEPSILATIDNTCLLKFSGAIEYPWKDGKSKFVQLDSKHIGTTPNNTQLEINTDCAKITIKYDENKYIDTVSLNYLEAMDKTNHKQCNLIKPGGNIFSSANDKHYRCDKKVAYGCRSDSGLVGKLIITNLEFECFRKKDAKEMEFSRPADDC